MRDSSSTDYYRYSWNVLLQKDATWKEKLVFVGVLAGGMAGMVGGGWWFNRKMGFQSYEFFILVVLFAVMIVGVLGYFWNMLLLRERYDVHHFAVDQKGVTFEKELISYGEIKVEAELEVLAHERGIGYKTRNSREVLMLALKTKRGDRELEFAEAEMKERVAKALEMYLEA